jgi:hypothetical protein
MSAVSTASSAYTTFTAATRASVAGAPGGSGGGYGSVRGSVASDGGKIRADSLVEVLDGGVWKAAWVRKKRHDGTYKVHSVPIINPK